MPRSKAVAKKSSEKPSKKNLHSQKIARKSAPVTTGVRKYRFRPGTVALREIKRYQKTTDLLIQKAPFQRKGTSLDIQWEPSSDNWETSRTSQELLSDSSHQLFWQCRKLARRQWLDFWKMHTYAPITPRDKLFSPQTLHLLAASEETNTDYPFSIIFNISISRHIIS